MLQSGSKQTKEKWRDFYVTPDYILEAVKACFQTDNFFDPCPVNTYDPLTPPPWDGLSIEWGLNTFINPPFSQYAQWVDWGFKQAKPQIWLCNSNTETKWYQRLLKGCSAICFPNKRINFINPKTMQPDNQNRNCQTIFYWGIYPFNFQDAFIDIGHIIVI